MTDDLQTRIAAALKSAAERRGIYRIADFDYPFLADAVIAVMGEANDDIRPALREALASWGAEKLSLDQTFELHERGCVCDDCLPDDID